MKSTIMACTLLLFTMICQGQNGTPSSSLPDEAKKKSIQNIQAAGGFFALSGLLLLSGAGFEHTGEKGVATILYMGAGATAVAGGVCVYHAGEWTLKATGPGLSLARKF